ncbi:hypothetical protein D9M68_650490 [compost metagenome]
MVLHGQAELEVFQQPSEVGALPGQALAHVGIDGRAAVVRAEPVIAARQVMHVQLIVHRVRFPAEEHRPLVEVLGPLDLGQHAAFAGLHQLEVAEAERVLPDHLLDQRIAVVARFDAVDPAAELLPELRQVGEALHTAVPGRLVHREGVLGTGEIGAEALHRAVVQVGADVVFAARHPVAEKDIDLAFAQGLVGVLGREAMHLGDVAQLAQHIAGDSGGDGDVAPADVGEVHGRTAFRVRGGECRLDPGQGSGQQRRCQQGSGGSSHR